MEKNRLRVLLVEDDAGDACLTRRALAAFTDPAYQVDVAASLSQARGCLATASYEVALLDLDLPESVGVETVARFREICRGPLPIIVLTDLDDERVALEMLDNGAQDCLVKNQLTSDMLSRSIRYARERQQFCSQLQAANELLQAKNQRLSEMYDTAQQFVENVSHDFRTPLTVIREFTSIVRDGYGGPVTPQQIEHLDRVLHRTDDLALMVDDMLDISKLEAGLLGVWRRPCRVGDMINNVAGLLRARAESKQLTLLTQVSPDLPEVFCDEEKVQRVLVNLSVNAIKFTPEGGRVEIWARPGEDGCEVLLGVSDSGPGICQSKLEVIFERFQQAEVNLRADTKGFGLGLCIAKELVHLNFGQIQVESEVGAGSTFKFTLPRNEPTILFDRFIRQRVDQGREPVHITLITARLPSQASLDAVPLVDEFLQRSVRAHDLVLQAGFETWLIAGTCSQLEAPAMILRLDRAWQDYARNCPTADLPPLSFSDGQSYACPCEVECLRYNFSRLVSSPGKRSKNGGTVLVVDDDAEVTSSLRVRLQAAGYNVLSADSGEEGLSTALACRPDAVVLDVRMPNKDGLTVLRELRESGDTRATPVVMLSASIRDQHHALEAGASCFLTKPYEAKDVLSALESAISERTMP